MPEGNQTMPVTRSMRDRKQERPEAGMAAFLRAVTSAWLAPSSALAERTPMSRHNPAPIHAVLPTAKPKVDIGKRWRPALIYRCDTETGEYELVNSPIHDDLIESSTQ